MGDVDTSMYKLPVQKSPFEIAGQLQSLEQGQNTITQQKLSQAKFGLEGLLRDAASIGPKGTPEQFAAMGRNAVKMGYVPASALPAWDEKIASFKGNMPEFYRSVVSQATNHAEALASQIGRYKDVDTNAGIISGVENPLLDNGGLKPGVGSFVPAQRPVGATYVGEGGLPSTVAPVGPLGVQRLEPAAGAGASAPALPTRAAPSGPASPAAAQPRAAAPPPKPSALPVNPPVRTDPYSQAGMPPMFEEGKKMITADQELAGARAMAVKPATQALALIPELKTGPGTGRWNDLVAAAKAWGVTNTKAFNDPTVMRQELDKKMAMYLSTSPIGQRSDAAQALAEASSPNPGKHLSQTLLALTRDAIALDRINIARPDAFKGGNLEKYGQHRATFPQNMDERAFTLDMIPKEERIKLVDTMRAKIVKNPNDKQADRFFRSLHIAKPQFGPMAE